ncbi:hypothetical protein [Psychrobacter sp. BI730]|uniref:hypothetical protein n=1 Tax=Psychrobacter sp. BI730 TaxID=2705463 RepID=UPI0015C74A03|nr:hypothetical protein [Psychrobacter sp. BI730]NYR09579.1 hypothetical protein [Psychrobacter sp. BI730]
MRIKVGDVFITKQGYEIAVISYSTHSCITVEFKDKNKHRLVTRARNIKRGGIENPYHPKNFGVGFMGVGLFSSRANSKQTDIYTAWRNMLMRCYCEKRLVERPTYLNCFVCDSWLNFQNFAQWMTDHNYDASKHQLDKDILKTNNKIYSADNCCLVPSEINNLFTDSGASRGKYPQGVTLHKGRFRARMSAGKKTIGIGFYDTPQEAHQAYVVAKEAYVKELANKWRGRIDERVYDALMNWTVHP